MEGTVKFYNDQKGFGFITPEDGSQDVFFHITQCEETYEMPQEGDVVTFEIGQGRDGRSAAQNVVFVGAGSEVDTADEAEEADEVAEEDEEQEEEQQEEEEEQQEEEEEEKEE